jgi:hypothetical protein
LPTIKWVKYAVIVRLVPIFLITMYIVYFESSKSNIELFPNFQLDSVANELLLGINYLKQKLFYSQYKIINHKIFKDQVFILVQFQLFLSGVLTTFTFTLMMEISYASCEPQIQASHFSLLSTCEVLGKLLIQPFISMYADSYGYSNAFILFSALYLVCVFNFAFYKAQPKQPSPASKSKSGSIANKNN